MKALPFERGAFAVDRLFFDAFLFAVRTRCPFHTVPPRYGDAHAFRDELKRFAHAGWLDQVLEQLRAHCPAVLEGADPHTFGAKALPRSLARKVAAEGRTLRDYGPADGELLLTAADMEVDPIVVRRFRVVGQFYCGASQKDLAARYKVHASFVSQISLKYRAHGLDGLRRLDDRRLARRKFDEAEFAKLEALVASAVDPADPGRKLKWDGIVRFCKTLNVDYSMNYVSKLLKERGVSLTAARAVKYGPRDAAA